MLKILAYYTECSVPIVVFIGKKFILPDPDNKDQTKHPSKSSEKAFKPYKQNKQLHFYKHRLSADNQWGYILLYIA
jgi:hypothetical protein